LRLLLLLLLLLLLSLLLLSPRLSLGGVRLFLVLIPDDCATHRADPGADRRPGAGVATERPDRQTRQRPDPRAADRAFAGVGASD
jgi:hypothetical protein